MQPCAPSPPQEARDQLARAQAEKERLAQEAQRLQEVGPCSCCAIPLTFFQLFFRLAPRQRAALPANAQVFERACAPAGAQAAPWAATSPTASIFRLPCLSFTTPFSPCALCPMQTAQAATGEVQQKVEEFHAVRGESKGACCCQCWWGWCREDCPA